MADDIHRWCEVFLGEAGLSAADLAPLHGQEMPKGPAIPARYADALPTDEGVRGWLIHVACQAAQDRRTVAAISTGPSLLLLGVTGTGKTFECYGVLRALTALGLYGRMTLVSAADLYARMRPRHGIDSEDEFEVFAVDAQLLIVDDLGAAKGSKWTEEVNYRLVNHRYERALPTIFTSNLLPGALAQELGERVASRLNEMTRRVTLKGTDRRYGGGRAA